MLKEIKFWVVSRKIQLESLLSNVDLNSLLVSLSSALFFFLPEEEIFVISKFMACAYCMLGSFTSSLSIQVILEETQMQKPNKIPQTKERKDYLS